MIFSALDILRLKGLHPKLRAAVETIMDEMVQADHPMMMVEGVRTQKRQIELYQVGRRGVKGERTLTDRNGTTHPSEHQVRADGLGYAADLCFLVGGKAKWSVIDPLTKKETLPWALYGEKAKQRGLIWGGDWKRYDAPHVELPFPVKAEQ